VYADGGYDSRENFNYLAGNDIEPVIKTRRMLQRELEVHHLELKK